jgi:hypothetical protein
MANRVRTGTTSLCACHGEQAPSSVPEVKPVGAYLIVDYAPMAACDKRRCTGSKLGRRGLLNRPSDPTNSITVNNAQQHCASCSHQTFALLRNETCGLVGL